MHYVFGIDPVVGNEVGWSGKFDRLFPSELEHQSNPNNNLTRTNRECDQERMQIAEQAGNP